MDEREIIYEPHPVSPERKAELVAAGYRIVDAIYAHAAGQAVAAAVAETSPEAPLTVGKGPGGRWYLKRGKEIVTGPFATQAEAEKAR